MALAIPDVRMPRWRAATAYWLTAYKRTWRGSVISSVVEPVLFLAAMGLGLGTYVHGQHGHGPGVVEGVRYVVFLAPGLLAAGAMQTAMGESSWPVMGAVKWTRTYTAMQASPLTTADIAVGHVVFMLLRVTMNAAIFVVIMAAFGVVRSPGGVVLAIPAAVLAGAAFAVLIAAFSVLQDSDKNLSLLYRFGLVPLFLFSGAFFPVSQLPGPLQPIAWVTPLWHGVELCRDLALGRGSAGGLIGHAAYLAGLTGLGFLLAVRAYRRRLLW
jgi:lipooligosaccharide transport system permease protein